MPVEGEATDLRRKLEKGLVVTAGGEGGKGMGTHIHQFLSLQSWGGQDGREVGFRGLGRCCLMK
jgi:hypothetical protein